MLGKYILRAGATAAALTCAAGPASADSYEVLMMDYAFFPEISYVQPGDTITFVNLSGITRIIEARNNAWATPEIPDGGSATISIIQGMKNDYITRIDGVGGNGVTGGTAAGTATDIDTTDGTNLDGQDAEEGTIIGKLNFSGAPVQTD